LKQNAKFPPKHSHFPLLVVHRRIFFVLEMDKQKAPLFPSKNRSFSFCPPYERTIVWRLYQIRNYF